MLTSIYLSVSVALSPKIIASRRLYYTYGPERLAHFQGRIEWIGLRGRRIRGGEPSFDETNCQEKIDLVFDDEDKLFDGLISASDPAQYLSAAFLKSEGGQNSLKEQALGYMQLLMEEEGFLNNLSPKELFSVAISNPVFVEASIRRLSAAGDVNGEFRMTPTFAKLLNGLPTSIDTAIAHYTLDAMDGICRLYAALLGPGPAGNYALAKQIIELRSWSAAAAQRSFLGALLRPSPLRRDDIVSAPPADSTVQEALAFASTATNVRQPVWEAGQARLAQLLHGLLQSPVGAAVEAALVSLASASRLRATEAGRMQLLGRAVMSDPFALNLLDVVLRLRVLAWSPDPAREAAALDAAWPGCFAPGAGGLGLAWGADPLYNPDADADAAAAPSPRSSPAPAGAEASEGGHSAEATGGAVAAGAGGQDRADMVDESEGRGAGAGAGVVRVGGGVRLAVLGLMCLEGADLMQAGVFRELQRLYAQARPPSV